MIPEEGKSNCVVCKLCPNIPKMCHTMALTIGSSNHTKPISLRKRVGTWSSETFAFLQDFCSGINRDNVFKGNSYVLAGGI